MPLDSFCLNVQPVKGSVISEKLSKNRITIKGGGWASNASKGRQNKSHTAKSNFIINIICLTRQKYF